MTTRGLRSATCKEQLGGIVGTEVRLFAYPNGKPSQDFTQGHFEILRSLDFPGAVTTSWGIFARVGDGLFQIPRFSP